MNFSFNDAYRVIKNVIDERISMLTKSGAGIEVTWGTVASIDDAATCSVYLLDEGVPSSGFRLENGIKPNLLDPVRVSIDKRGNRWIDAILNDGSTAFPKMEIDPRSGEVRLGDGTVAPTPVVTTNSQNLEFESLTVNDLSVPVVERIGPKIERTIEDIGGSTDTAVKFSNKDVSGGPTSIDISGAFGGYQRSVRIYDDDADVHPQIQIGKSSGTEAEIKFGSGGSNSPDVRLSRPFNQSDVLALDSGDSFRINNGSLMFGSATAFNKIKIVTVATTNGATVFIPDVDITRTAMALIGTDGNDGAGLMGWYRHGSFNYVQGLWAGSQVGFQGSTFSAGANSWSWFIESNVAGARLAVKNNAGFSRAFRLLVLEGAT